MAMPASLTFYPTADSYVSSSNPSSNYGTATLLRLDASPDLHGYIGFLVQGTSGTPISRASLKLYANTNSTLGFQVAGVGDTTWGEKTINYSNAPSLGSILTSSGPTVSNSWATLDITSYISGDGTYNLGILTSSSSAMSFPSREANSNNPQLVLEFGTINTTDSQAPSVPTGLSANAVSQQVNLAWSASTDNVGVTGYTIYRNGINLTTVSGSTLSYSDATVSPSTTYAYSVDAFDQTGNHSAASLPVNVTTQVQADTQAPSVPTGLTAAAVSSSQVDLSWAVSTDNVGVTGYTIYRNGVSLTTVSGSTISYSDVTVAPETTYTYTLDAFDLAGNHSALSSPVSVTTAALTDTQAPSVPANLTAVSSSPNVVNINWSASTDNIGVIGYAIYRDGTNITSVSGSTLSYADNSVSPNTSYAYTLDAFDQAGNHSAVTSPVSVTTQSLPSQIILSPDADTYVNASNPASNYGTATTLRMDASPDIHGFLRITISGTSGRTISKVTLKIFTNTSSTLGIQVLSVSDTTWTEKTMTYDTAPPLGPVIASSGAITASTWVTFDITTYITGDGTYSVGIQTPSSSAISVQSREASSNPPQLVIDVN